MIFFYKFYTLAYFGFIHVYLLYTKYNIWHIIILCRPQTEV